MQSKNRFVMVGRILGREHPFYGCFVCQCCHRKMSRRELEYLQLLDKGVVLSDTRKARMDELLKQKQEHSNKQCAKDAEHRAKRRAEEQANPKPKKPKKPKAPKIRPKPDPHHPPDKGIYTNDGKVQKRLRWSDEEKAAFRKGFEQHGVGKWQVIKDAYPNELRNRTADQIRTHYRHSKECVRCEGNP